MFNYTDQNKVKLIQQQLSNLRREDRALLLQEVELEQKIANLSRVVSTSCKHKTLHEDERNFKELKLEHQKIRNHRKNIYTEISNRIQLLRFHTNQIVCQKELQKLRFERSKVISKRFMPTRFPIMDTDKTYDFFISHASEDKEAFVRPLANHLTSRGVKVWYDEYTLKIGDSLRQCIEKGLRDSKYGIVILSKHFFSKAWPNRELDGLTVLEIDGLLRILPLWHGVSRQDVAHYSPILADKYALDTSLNSIEEITNQLMRQL